MAYSTEFFRAIEIGLFINLKMERFRFEFVPTKEIAEYLKIPAPTVVRILRSLTTAGITATKEGAKGGVVLAKPMRKITLLDLFLAVEPGAMFKIQLDYFVDNPRLDPVKVKITGCLQDAEKAMKDSLKKTTLSDIFYSYQP